MGLCGGNWAFWDGSLYPSNTLDRVFCNKGRNETTEKITSRRRDG